MTRLRDHIYLGTTQSLCPECLALVPAKIIVKGNRDYFRKRCPTHGVREDFVCSDVARYDQMEYSLPGKVPATYGVEPDRGCPYDCGLCTEHEQQRCIGLVETTSACNLKCPKCFASSGPGGAHPSYAECVRAIDRLVAVEGRAEVLQLSGGEPTIHSEFERILDYAAAQPIDIVMINTNGIRFASLRCSTRLHVTRAASRSTFSSTASTTAARRLCGASRWSRSSCVGSKRSEAAGSKRRLSARCSPTSTSTKSARSSLSDLKAPGSPASVSAGDLFGSACRPRRPRATHHLSRRH